MSRRIFGIDPGLATVGYGVIEVLSREQQKVLEYGVIKTPAKNEPIKRLEQIYREIGELLDAFNPGLVAVEDLYFGKNAKTAMHVGQARGVLLLAVSQHNIPLVEFTPLQVKIALTGYGRADKQQMQSLVKQLLQLEEIPKPDDAADALAVAVTAAVSSSTHEH